jgi:uncharacterized Zn finger protein (UPF0148 family)
MSGQKCVACGKTAYPLESHTVGDCRWHKICFKCVKCGVALNVKTFFQREGQAYCGTCGSARFDKNAQAADTLEMRNVKEKPKVAPVNEQMRGELVGQKSMEGTDSMGIGAALSRPKVGTVNEQVRGADAGEKTNVTADSLYIDRALNAPKLATGFVV